MLPEKENTLSLDIEPAGTLLFPVLRRIVSGKGFNINFGDSIQTVCQLIDEYIINGL